MKIKENKRQRAVHVSQPIPLQSHSRHISCVRGGSCWTVGSGARGSVECGGSCWTVEVLRVEMWSVEPA